MFRASSLPIIRNFLRFQAESGLCLEAVIKNLHETYSAECTVEIS